MRSTLFTVIIRQEDKFTVFLNHIVVEYYVFGKVRLLRREMSLHEKRQILCSPLSSGLPTENRFPLL